MSPADLLSALGDEWDLAEPEEMIAPTRWSCNHRGDRESATHGCPESGRPPLTWSEAYGAYIDGMGRIARCGSCPSCAGTGWTSLRDPWTDELLTWWGAPCLYCTGGWNYHRWDCDGHDDAYRREPRTVERWGVTFDGRSFVAGEVVAPREAVAA